MVDKIYKSNQHIHEYWYLTFIKGIMFISSSICVYIYIIYIIPNPQTNLIHPVEYTIQDYPVYLGKLQSFTNLK